MKFILISIPFLLLLLSCEKQIDFEVPDTGRMLTIESRLWDTNWVFVSLFHSKHILDTSKQWDIVYNAKATLFENGVLFDKLYERKYGGYKSDKKVSPGSSYKLVINTAEYGETISETYIPEVTGISKFELENNFANTGNRVNFNLSFYDNKDTDNYYILNLFWGSFSRKFVNYLNKDYLNYEGRINFNIDYTKPDINQFGYIINKGLIFNDEIFNGQLFNMKISTLKDPNQLPLQDSLEHYYIIQLYSISSNYYKYLTTREEQQNNRDNYYSEPVQVFNNIKNGVGIFAGISSTSDSIRINIDDFNLSQ